MMSLRGIFPAPPKEPKKNFIRENVKQLKLLQSNRNNNENKRQACNRGEAHHLNVPTSNTNLPLTRCHKSNPQLNKLPSYTLNSASYNGQCSHQQNPTRIKKGNMSEFMKRKQVREHISRNSAAKCAERECQQPININVTKPVAQSKDAGCQYVDPDTIFLSDGARLRVIYPSKRILDLINVNMKDQGSGTGDFRNRDDRTPDECLEKTKEVVTPMKVVSSRYMSHNDLNETDRINKLSISSPKKIDTPHPTIAREEKPNPLMAPPTYQKGVVPKYIQERKEQLREAVTAETDDQCPPGYMVLPEFERVETLKILKKKFAELVTELNKMPVRTDTLRMRNRKMQLDKELEKLEDGIKVFSRSKVHIDIKL